MIQICIICIRLFDNSQGQIIENLFQIFFYYQFTNKTNNKFTCACKSKGCDFSPQFHTHSKYHVVKQVV